MEANNLVIPRIPPCKGVPNFPPKFRFEDNRLLHYVTNEVTEKTMCDEFLTLLAVCHDVIAEYPGCAHEKAAPDASGHVHVHGFDLCTTPVAYQAASPDEKALVEAAKDLQYYFMYRGMEKVQVGKTTVDDAQTVRVNMLGATWDFKVLASLEFTSSRKRASVIVKDPRDGKIKVYIKGADTVVYELMDEQSKGAMWQYTSAQLSRFSQIGLRTLVCCYKVISEAEFEAWYADYKKAKSDMVNRAGMVANAEAAIEKNMVLIGSTAIEDRLQDGVPECIAKLAKAGIKICILTGDKVETAINIGRSCKLVSDIMQPENNKLIVIDIDEKLKEEEARRQCEIELKAAWELVKNNRDGQDDQGSHLFATFFLQN